MLFRQKGRIRKKENEHLIALLEKVKDELETQKSFLRKSVDPPQMMHYQLKLTEAKYLFLLREARIRQAAKIN
ncbi:MAG TPA: YaaL family protein [Bacilli bacterium]|nr:YaaL family protein [Bacilli bacterium]